MTPEQMKKRILELDGDIYLMSQTLKIQDEAIKDLTAKYELLLNRVKCSECVLQNQKERDPDIGPEITY